MRGIGALFLTAAMAAACGTSSSRSLVAPTVSPTAPAQAERLFVEGDQASTILDTSTGRTVATLPGGVLSPAKDLIVSVAQNGSHTTVRGVDLTGKTVLGVDLAGDYRLTSAYGASPSGFSPNGKWLVLVSRDATDSSFAIVDVTGSGLTRTVKLSARFTFDAIHNDGTAMYLIEHPKPGATTYNVRFYDLAARVLRPDIIFDKAAIGHFDPTVGLMDGTFHVSVAPKSGDWSYGLYMRPNGKPFVHALNVPGHYAQCIVDLAGTWSSTSMFSMALSNDGNRLYVVDTASGNVSVIDALTQHVVRTATFATRSGSGDPRGASAVISRDGSRLYASAARGVAVLQTSDLTLKAWAAPDISARSLALSSDGSRLYALVGDAVQVIDAVSGRVLAQLANAPAARALHVLARTSP